MTLLTAANIATILIVMIVLLTKFVSFPKAKPEPMPEPETEEQRRDRTGTAFTDEEIAELVAYGKSLPIPSQTEWASNTLSTFLVTHEKEPDNEDR